MSRSCAPYELRYSLRGQSLLLMQSIATWNQGYAIHIRQPKIAEGDNAAAQLFSSYMCIANCMKGVH